MMTPEQERQAISILTFVSKGRGYSAFAAKGLLAELGRAASDEKCPHCGTQNSSGPCEDCKDERAGLNVPPPVEPELDFELRANCWLRSFKGFDVGGVPSPAPTVRELQNLRSSLANELRAVWQNARALPYPPKAKP